MKKKLIALGLAILPRIVMEANIVMDEGNVAKSIPGRYVEEGNLA